MMSYPIDKNGNIIKPGMHVKFRRPRWDETGRCTLEEVIEQVETDSCDGSLYAQNYEDDVFYVDWSEMEVVTCK